MEVLHSNGQQRYESEIKGLSEGDLRTRLGRAGDNRPLDHWQITALKKELKLRDDEAALKCGVEYDRDGHSLTHHPV